MPQGEGTYGSQVGRPSKKRTSYVNDNNWWNKLKQGVSDLRPYNPQALVQNMKYREGKSVLTTKPRVASMDDDRSMPSPKPSRITEAEISEAVRRLEDNPGLRNQAYTGGRKNSRSITGLWKEK